MPCVQHYSNCWWGVWQNVFAKNCHNAISQPTRIYNATNSTKRVQQKWYSQGWIINMSHTSTLFSRDWLLEPSCHAAGRPREAQQSYQVDRSYVGVLASSPAEIPADSQEQPLNMWVKTLEYDLTSSHQVLPQALNLPPGAQTLWSKDKLSPLCEVQICDLPNSVSTIKMVVFTPLSFGMVWYAVNKKRDIKVT